MKFTFFTTIIIFIIFINPAFGIKLTGNVEYDIYESESYVDTYDESILNIHMGSRISHLSSYENSSIIIKGGEISFFDAYENSRAVIYYVEDLSWLIVNDDCKIGLIGTEFTYQGGRLSGKWENGQSFSFWLLQGQGQGQPPTHEDEFMPHNVYFIDPQSLPLPDDTQPDVPDGTPPDVPADTPPITPTDTMPAIPGDKLIPIYELLLGKQAE